MEVDLARINPAKIAMDAEVDTVIGVLRQMKAAGKGVIGMKILGAGRLRTEVDKSLQFALSLDCVDAFTIGSEGREEMMDLVKKIPAASVRASFSMGSYKLNVRRKRMLTTRAILSSLLTIGAAGILLFADEPKKSGGSGILHPEMKVEGGSYDKPMGKLGEKPAQPWSATTTAAGVDGKPQTGRVVTRVGEIVDFSCYLQLGKHGEKHRSCGQKCARTASPSAC